MFTRMNAAELKMSVTCHLGLITETHARARAPVELNSSVNMWIVSRVIPVLKLYMIGLKVLLYQLWNTSFTLPGL